ncbi:MAG: AAA family ATPase [Armatimonadetes bacterium]|nr:AAA family ATPase [Armatimonadota bacterium]MBS1726466.1 AAA family ATPase [Armatimonadota bacterium]
MTAASEIEILVRSKYPILYIVSWEERRVEAALLRIASELKRTLHVWSLTQGMRPSVPQSQGKSSLPGELEALAQVYESGEGTIFLLKDYHPYMKDPRVIRLLRDIAFKLRSRAQTLVLMGPTLNLPSDLEKEVSVVDFPLPDATEIGGVLDKALTAVKDNPNIDSKVSDEDRETIIKSCQGLTLDEIESVFARSIVQTKKFDQEVILEEKQQIIRKTGILEYYPPNNSLADVGGMESIKEWLDQRSTSFTDKAREFGIPVPKGILLLGVQGCGKSLTAKAIAANWKLPMLKLDVGRIFGSLVGQSEENIRKAISTAESVAPCILWADELEKGFAGTSSVGDSGTTARVFATFLTWMQDKTAPVFLIATANDVSALPPELLRKGRFDEIFFIDLPKLKEREQIFDIHLRKRKRDPKTFKLKLKPLAEKTEGFSGAEIETVVVAALQRAYHEDRDLIQDDLVKEVAACVPLSVMMKEDMEALRDWAHLRARPAS